MGWREMLYVTEGTLTLVLSGVSESYETGTFAIYNSSQEYSYANEKDRPVCFVKNVLM